MALIQCPECGKEISSFAKSCPNCGYPIDGNPIVDNQHCSPYQQPQVTVVQKNRNSRNPLIAMSMCIAGAILSLLSHYISLPYEAYQMWCMIANFCVISAWLIWLLREKNKNVSNIVGAIICCASLLGETLWFIQASVWFDFFKLDTSTFYEFLSYLGLINSLLLLALGITLFFLKCNGKIRKLTVVVGVLFIIYYMIWCIFSVLEIAHIERPISDTVYYHVVNILCYILLIITILLFYNTYKQERIRPKAPKKKRKISKGVGIVIVLLALLGGFFIWKTHYEKEEKARIERMDQERIEQERRIEQKRKEQEQREQEQMEQERLEQERKKQERIEQERIEHERRLNSAPYGYDQWGVPYASLDQKNLAEALDEYDKARLGYIKATTTGDYWDLMYYHQCMKRQIENCLFYAKSLGDEKLIYELKKMERDVDNLGF